MRGHLSEWYCILYRVSECCICWLIWLSELRTDDQRVGGSNNGSKSPHVNVYLGKTLNPLIVLCMAAVTHWCMNERLNEKPE